MTPLPPRSTLFPYTTLFRSHLFEQRHSPRRPLASRRCSNHAALQEQPRRNVFERNRAVRYRTQDRKSTRLNSSHTVISYAVFCLKKKKKNRRTKNKKTEHKS